MAQTEIDEAFSTVSHQTLPRHSNSPARCKVCGREGTVRSHLIPRAFILQLRGDDKHALLSDIDRPGRKFTQSGSCSSDILCSEHEGVTGELDGAAVRLCKAAWKHAPFQIGQNISLKVQDTSLIVKFIASVLWRCHHSGLDEARFVDLGRYASEIEEIIFAGADHRHLQAYAYVAASRTFDTREIASLPSSERVGVKRRWGFTVGGVHFLLDIGSGRPELPEYLIVEKGDVTMPIFDFDKSSLFASWQKLVTLRK